MKTMGDLWGMSLMLCVQGLQEMQVISHPTMCWKAETPRLENLT